MAKQLWQMCPYGCGTKLSADTNGGLGRLVAQHMDRCKKNPNRKK
jgi:hypothetical protein